MRIRSLGLFVAAVAILFHAFPAEAAGPLSFADPKGDALDKQDGFDIVGVSYAMAKTKTGAPQINVKLTLAGPPRLQLASYNVLGSASPVEGCGRFEVDFRPGTLADAAVGGSPFELWVEDCLAPDDVNGNQILSNIPGEVKGSTITWFVPLDSLKKKARAVGKITDIHAFTYTGDPLFGLMGTHDFDINTDDAVTDKAFVYA
ncbi:MAG TPA: hypothetical protein VM030_08455 [Acidimicrobiales bacterium]|nr:hypothetical protein [Acidimicrobiales bacterium]